MAELIATYLRDHHMGASGGVELFERVAEGHSDPAVREAVERIRQQVVEERQTVEEILDRVGASPNRVADAAAWVGEKVARLKPNNRIAKRSPLSDVLELEMLVDAVFGKSLMFRALVELNDERLKDIDVRGLWQQALAQRDELEELRIGQLHKLHLD